MDLIDMLDRLSDLDDEELTRRRREMERRSTNGIARTYLPIVQNEEIRRRLARAELERLEAQEQADRMEALTRATLRVATWTLAVSLLGIVVAVVVS